MRQKSHESAADFLVRVSGAVDGLARDRKGVVPQHEIKALLSEVFINGVQEYFRHILNSEMARYGELTKEQMYNAVKRHEVYLGRTKCLGGGATAPTTPQFQFRFPITITHPPNEHVALPLQVLRFNRLARKTKHPPKVQYFGYFQSHLGCLLLVITLSRLTGRNSTVPPKSIPNVTSLEPLICPWEAFSLQKCHILPKRNISLVETQHPPKVKYFLNTDITDLQGGRHDGDPHTTRYDP